MAAGLQHVFATGSRLDSGRVAARVVEAWTGEPGVGARLLLYRDSLPMGILDPALPDSLRPLPDYVGLVGDSGSVEIGFLPDGAFSMVALSDANGNYRPDAGEPVAWWADAIPTLDSTAAEPLLRMDAPPVQPATYLSGMRVDSSGYWRANSKVADEGHPDRWSEQMDMAIAGPGDTVKVRGDSPAGTPGFQPDDAELGTCSIRPGWTPSGFGRWNRRPCRGWQNGRRARSMPVRLGRCGGLRAPMGWTRRCVRGPSSKARIHWP